MMGTAICTMECLDFVSTSRMCSSSRQYDFERNSGQMEQQQLYHELL
jgi:hypothetical protein